jgi:hypothetical protein
LLKQREKIARRPAKKKKKKRETERWAKSLHTSMYEKKEMRNPQQEKEVLLGKNLYKTTFLSLSLSLSRYGHQVKTAKRG